MAQKWTRTVPSADLAPGDVVPVEVGDEALAVWRTDDGRACAFDARCPHQWSHLGYEGVVVGDELVCAAHAWRFATDGTGTKVNVNGRRDEKAPVPVFPTREVDGWVEVDLP